ncbi:MAG: V-type ATP synthase subunit E [Oscillospiraceae bacterium]|jgi:V/A-type H+-transporting ATPase subunit E|nr:V-type ATP synthase subunit E [Oscillospiraceae bacterium]
MTGIEKIIGTIERDGAAKCEEILAAARGQAEEIRAEAALQAARAAEAAIDEARRKAQSGAAAAGARTAQAEKRVLLQMKNEVIRQAVACALARLRALPEAEYFGALARLVAEHAQPGPGEIRFSRRDLDRLPAGFAQGLANLTVSPQPAGIEDGFVLAYGDVEQNCTFEALLSARLDDIKDALHAHLFALPIPQQGGE